MTPVYRNVGQHRLLTDSAAADPNEEVARIEAIQPIGSRFNELNHASVQLVKADGTNATVAEWLVWFAGSPYKYYVSPDGTSTAVQAKIASILGI